MGNNIMNNVSNIRNENYNVSQSGYNRIEVRRSFVQRESDWDIPDEFDDD